MINRTFLTLPTKFLLVCRHYAAAARFSNSCSRPEIVEPIMRWAAVESRSHRTVCRRIAAAMRSRWAAIQPRASSVALMRQVAGLTSPAIVSISISASRHDRTDLSHDAPARAGRAAPCLRLRITVPSFALCSRRQAAQRTRCETRAGRRMIRASPSRRNSGWPPKSSLRPAPPPTASSRRTECPRACLSHPRSRRQPGEARRTAGRDRQVEIARSS